ncbi:hypothetical protein GCM10017687_24120 [Streptomyces echinatus]
MALEQVYAVARWVGAHGGACGLDGGRLAVAGVSAGANLAAALALLASRRGGPRLAHQVLVCPVTDARMDTASYREFGDGYFLGREAMGQFWRQYVPDATDRLASTACPARATDEELAGLPPALVVTAEADVLRDEGESYAARLRRARVPVVSMRYHGTVHGFVLFDELRDSTGGPGGSYSGAGHPAHGPPRLARLRMPGRWRRERPPLCHSPGLGPSSARATAAREAMPSLGKALARCPPTVRGDRLSRAPISLFVSPSAASRAIRSSCAVREAGRRSG